MKVCTKCGAEKPINAFSPNGKGFLRPSCKLCKAKQQKASKLKRYGLTHDQFIAMRNEQKNRCAICKFEDELVVDHCHVTCEVRGLLCGKCNKGLGMFDDNIGRLKAAISYLKTRDERYV